MSTLSDLTAEINTQIPTGVDHAITAAKVRTTLIDMATKILSDQSLLGGGGGGAGSLDRYLTSNTSANPGDVCYCNTSAGGFTVTLPANPIPGTGVGFRDAESSWAAANLTVNPGTNKIENDAGNLVCDVTNGNFDLVWTGTPSGWDLVAVSSFGGGGGGTIGSGVSYLYISANKLVPAGGIYYCDTVTGGFTLTLPAGPAVGDGMSFKDASGTWGIHNLILDPGANAINNLTSPLSIDQSDIDFDLVWRGAPVGWQVQIPVTNAARGAVGSAGFLRTKPFAVLGQTAAATRGAAITWSTTDKHSNIVMSSGNLKATATASAASLSLSGTSVRATNVGSAGKYFEVTWGSGGTPDGFGVANATQSLSAYSGTPNGVGLFSTGYVEWPFSGFSNNWGGTFGVGDVMGCLLGASTVQFFKNGTLIYTVDNLPSGGLYPILSTSTAGENATANFGATTMAFLPIGATSWDGSQTGVGPTTWSTTDQSGLTFSSGNLKASGTGTGGGQGRATRSGTSGHYFEIHIDSDGASNNSYVGLANPSQTVVSGYAGNPNGISYFENGYAEWPGSGTAGHGATYAAGDTIGVRLLASTAEFYKNGALQFTALLPSGSLYPIVGLFVSGASATANFGASTFANLPSGAVGWNT
jgi:hypothetical protein